MKREIKYEKEMRECTFQPVIGQYNYDSNERRKYNLENLPSYFDAENYNMDQQLLEQNNYERT